MNRLFLLSLVASVATYSDAQLADREVTFKGAGGLELKGSLRLPEKKDAKVPSVLLLPGSGPPDRNGNVAPSFNTNLLKEIAERLAAEGFATLRFDKRSAITYANDWPKDVSAISKFFVWENFVGDAKSALEYLRAQPEIDTSKVGVLGHSEGGTIALQLGHDLPAEAKPAFLILAATPGRNYGELVKEQVAFGMDVGGMDPGTKKLYLDSTAKAIEQMKKEKTIPSDLPRPLLALFNPAALDLLQAYFTIDPVALAKAYTGPVLVLQGDRDVQVLAKKDPPALDRAFRSRKAGSVRVAVLPSLSHNFKAVKDERTEAGVLGPVAPEMLTTLVDWLKKL